MCDRRSNPRPIRVEPLRLECAVPSEEQITACGVHGGAVAAEQPPALERIELPYIDAARVRGAVDEEDEMPAVRQEIRIPVSPLRRCLDARRGL